MHRRAPDRLEMEADIAAGEIAERDWRIGRPEGRRSDGGDRLAADIRENGEPIDVARLALIGTHAERGVALQMLDRAEAFARREFDIAYGHVVLDINEALAARPDR